MSFLLSVYVVTSLHTKHAFSYFHFSSLLLSCKKITVETIVMVYHCILHDEVIGVHHNPPTRLHIRRKLRRGAIAFSNNKI